MNVIKMERRSKDDRVIVPFGEYEHQTEASITDIEYFSAEEVPMPVERMKSIICSLESDL